MRYHEVVFSKGEVFPEYQINKENKGSVDLSGFSDTELQVLYHTAIQKLSGLPVPVITLHGGIWTVGEDIPSGTYDIKAYLEEAYGNYSFFIYNKTEGSSVLGPAQISLHGYGNEGLTTASHIEFKDGSIVVTDGCMAVLSPADENVFFG